MKSLDDMCESDPLLAEEVRGLTRRQRDELERIVALRKKAAVMADRIAADPSDVFHQLQQLQRTPAERLRLGLRHGRRRRRIPDRS